MMMWLHEDLERLGLDCLYGRTRTACTGPTSAIKEMVEKFREADVEVLVHGSYAIYLLHLVE